MSEKDNLKFEGVIEEVLPDGEFIVTLETGGKVRAKIGGRMRQVKFLIMVGDKVEVELTPYDLSKGRIVSRGE